jgi:hypothetical protein
LRDGLWSFRRFSFEKVASLRTRSTPVLFRLRRSGGQLEVQVGWVYGIKADSYSNSCKRA